MARLHPRFGPAAALLVSGTMMSPALAQEAATTPTAADQAKAQAELTSTQLANAKAMQELITANKQDTEGKATLENIETGAEAMRLKHIVDQQLGVQLARAIEAGKDRKLIVIYGTQPPTTAHYLSLKHASAELERNTTTALADAAKVFDKPTRKPPRRHPHDLTTYMQTFGAESFVPGIGVAVAAVSTVASLLRVDTSMKGAALTTDAESLGPIVADRLAANGWKVQGPRTVAKKTEFADGLVEWLRPDHEKAAKYYGTYLGRLAGKGGKVEDLPEDERVAGMSLATVINDYKTLVDALYTPVEGVLPASVLEEEKALATATDDQPILYIQKPEAALTSITKKGFLTGIGTVPAFVSASANASYVFVNGGEPKFGSVSYQTPVMRITNVAAWADAAELERPNGAPAAGSSNAQH